MNLYAGAAVAEFTSEI